MILIFSEGKDLMTSKVIEWLNRFDVPVLRINQEEVHLVELCVRLEERTDISLSFKHHVIHLSHVSYIWFRRGELRKPSGELFTRFGFPEQIKQELRIHYSAEMHTLHSYIYTLCKGFCLNNPSHYRINKLSVLESAKDCGLKTPPTIITNSKEELLKFIKIHRDVITKNIQDICVINYKHYQQAQRTTLLTQDIISRLPDKFGYSLFQAKILKKYEIRSFFFNNKTYCIANFSQSNELSLLDSRNLEQMTGALNRLTRFRLPADIERKVTQLMNGLELNSGSIDFIVTPELEFYFLEINTVGQFSYVNEAGNYGLEKIIASFLKQKHEEKFVSAGRVN